MDSKELRLGNWVKHNTNWCYRKDNTDDRELIFQWEDRDWYALSECTMFIENIEPIPITVDILHKCLEYLDDITWGSDEFRISDDDGLWGVYIYNTFIRHIEFLHELQNGYSWIMQKELEVEI